MSKHMPLPVRLEKYINRTETCWLWTGKPSVHGYGQIKLRGKVALAHREMYQLARGPIPTGMVIDHICHVKICVNPKHLQAVSHKQNLENLSGVHIDSTSGYRGVHRNRSGRYEVQVGHNGKKNYGGVYSTPEEANEAAIALRNRLFTNNLGDH